MEKIIKRFLPGSVVLKSETLSGGLIHQTYKITVEEKEGSKSYVLQRMNTAAFKEPFKVMRNIKTVQDFFKGKNYPLAFPEVLSTSEGDFLIVDEEGFYWRMFAFIEDSVCYESPPENVFVYKAGKAYGIFLTFLKDMDSEELEITIPDFHNLSNRFKVFKNTIAKASKVRLEKAATEIQLIENIYYQFQLDFSHLPIRPTHNDCKLSNLLFNKNSNRCIAVIDLDTLMPGYVVTDFGDMVRVMCSTASENEANLEKVSFDVERFRLLKKGFLDSTQDWLTSDERDSLSNGAIYIILEQAIRFLQDYLNEDQYYTVTYAEHNLMRAKNQRKLLEEFLKEVIK